MERILVRQSEATPGAHLVHDEVHHLTRVPCGILRDTNEGCNELPLLMPDLFQWCGKLLWLLPVRCIITVSGSTAEIAGSVRVHQSGHPSHKPVFVN